MKRHKDSFKQRLAVGNPRAAENFDENKHYLRPISFNFLSQIPNAAGSKAVSRVWRR